MTNNVQNDTLNLSTRDQHVIAAAYHRALSPVSEIARHGKLRTHTVRRTLQRCIEERVITPKAFVDVYRLGYTQFELCYATAAPSQRATQSFLAGLQRSPRVAWIGEYSGEYQYILTVCCRSPRELVRFIEETTASPHVSVTKRLVAVRVSYTEFPLTCLSERVKGDRPLMFGVEGVERIDEKDHEILKHISEDASLTTRELARTIGLSQSATIQRVRSLERRGIVPGYSYVVDFSRLGLQAFSIIISAKTHTAQLTKKILEFARTHSEVIYVVEAVGAFDYKLGVLLERPSNIVMLAQEVSEQFAAEISWLTTLTAFDYRKVSRYPFHELEP